MKKVLLVHHCDAWGGAGISLLYCCKMLLNEYDVTVCLPHKESEVGKQLNNLEELTIISFEEEIAMVSSYNGGPKWYSRTFWKNLFRIKRSDRIINEILEKGKYDLVIANSMTLSWISRTVRKKGIKSICYVRETKRNNIGFLISKYFIDKFCDGVLFISVFDKNSMRFKNRKQMVIPDVVEFGSNYTNKYGITKDKFVVVYLGGNEYIKGYPTVRELLEKKNLKDITVVIAGNVNEEEKINNDNIYYVGKVVDVGELLHEADLLIFPSLVGHQARPIFEAGAFHIPVVASAYPQVSENLIDGWNGFGFTPGDAEELMKKIIMIKNMPKRREMGDNNYDLYIRNHSYESCQLKLTTFISEILC